jgi:hypothetical protein
MKGLLRVIFLLNGCFFLLVGTVLYPSITQTLFDIQAQSTIASPDFWELSRVLSIVRVIFIIVGIFLTGFGLAMILLRNRWSFWL